MRITGIPADPGLLELPWSTPLENWPRGHLVALPRGLSRHVVRFVRVAGRIYAVKEISERLARREYQVLRDLARVNAPAVEATAVVTGRLDREGEPLEAALVSRHLQYSLPYRALFSGTLRPDTINRLLDALAVLLVRLHLVGFFWGDCSLSNTLFRRDAGAFAAYLVDAETGERHPRLSDGQRAHDIEVAHTNIYGELLDLSAGDYLDEAIDPLETSQAICDRYRALWAELTDPQVLDKVEWHRVDARIRRLNRLGFDVAELQIERDSAGGERLVVWPKVVDAGHHQRRLLRLTGLDVEENQARRLLNDLDTFRVAKGLTDEEEIVAHRWLADAFQPTVQAAPEELRRKLEPAQLFHEVLDHRWFLSEAAGAEVSLAAAVRSYVANVLVAKPDEKAVLGAGEPG